MTKNTSPKKGQKPKKAAPNIKATYGPSLYETAGFPRPKDPADGSCGSLSIHVREESGTVLVCGRHGSALLLSREDVRYLADALDIIAEILGC